MSLKLTYRITDLAPIPADTTVKGMELTYEDLDGNLRSIKVAIDGLQSNLKFDASGLGIVPNNIWDGSPTTISYNTVGAPSVTGTNATGTWDINVLGQAGSVDWSNVLNKPENLGAYIDPVTGNLVANGDTVDFANLTGYVVGHQIADAALTVAKFASNIEPVTVVSAIPDTKLTSSIYNTQDGKLYRWDPAEHKYVVSVNTTDLVGQLTAEQIAPYAIDPTKLAPGMEFIETVTELPTIKHGNMIFNNTDGKLYKWNGTAYVAAVNTTDLEGTLKNAQIEALAASKITGSLSDNQLSAISAAKITGQVIGDQIADAALTTAKFASGIEPVTLVTSGPLPTTKSTTTIFYSPDNKMYRWDGSAYIASVAATDLNGQITTTQITDNAITTDKIVANAITAGKIAVGAVSADQISAGAITTSKLFVSGRGNAINDDPMFTDSSAWATDNRITYATNGALSTATHAQGSSYVQCSVGASNAWATSRKYAINPLKTYRLTANLYAAAGNDRNMYIFVRMFRADGVTELTGSDTGWGGSLAGYVYGGQPPVNVWSTQGGLFGFNTALTIPSSAAYMEVGVWFQYSGGGASSVIQACQNLYITEAVDNSLIVDGTISGDKIIANSITANQIAASAITADAIASNAITAVKIQAGAIETAKIAAGAVSANEIAAGAIVADKIAANAVTADAIAANAITAGKISANTITGDKIAANTIAADNIASNAITTVKIDAAAITGVKIAANTIDASKIVANSLTAGEIAAGAIGADEIAAGAVRTDKLFVTGRGKALNDDPACSDNSAWSVTAGAAISITDNGSPSGTTVMKTTDYTRFISRTFPISGSTVYKVSVFGKKVSGTGLTYIRLYGFNSTGGLVNYEVIPMTGGGTYEGISLTSSWVRYSGTVTTSSSATYAYASIHSNWDGPGESRFTDFRVEERIGADLIVDGTISAGKMEAGLMSADNVLTRNLTIRDANGNIILSSGTSLAANRITPDAGWLNSNVNLGSLGYTGATNATFGKSLGVPFENWYIGTNSIVTLTDGKVGSKALRIVGGGGYSNQGNFIPIDRSKKYRTRFWARPSANNTSGLLYFSLRQFLDIAGSTAGPVNGGRSPYKPSGQNPTTHNSTYGAQAWGEYSYTWDSSDWQTGVAYVQPEFLDNYSGAAGYWEVQDFTFEEVTEVLAAATTAIWTTVTGTGKPADNANNTYVDASGNIQGVSSGAGTNVDNSYNALANNLIPNSDQASAMTWVQGWNPYSANLDYALQWASNIWGMTYNLKGSSTKNLVIHQSGVTANGDDATAVDIYPLGAWDWSVNGIPVIPAQKYCFSVYVVAHRCKASLGIQFWDAAGNYLGEAQSGVKSVLGGQADALQYYSRIFVSVVAPANSAYAMMYIRKHNTLAGQSDSWLWMAAPQFESINANAGASPYSAGPATNTRQLGYTGTLDANTTYVDDSGKIQGVSRGANTSVSNSLVETNAFLGDNVIIDGNTITKSYGAASDWNAQAYSKIGYKNGAFCSFQALTAGTYNQLMVGINTDPTTNASWNTLDYAVYLFGNAILVYSNGSQIGGQYGTYVSGDIFTIVYDGYNVIMSKNGTTFYTTTTANPITDPLYFDSSFVTPGAAIQKVQFGPLSSSNWNSINGTNRPADNANNTYIDASGLIQGVSSGANTAVKNSLISISDSGVLNNGVSTSSVSLPGLGQDIFRIIATGSNQYTSPDYPGFYKNGVKVYTPTRSYYLVIMRRSDSAITFSQAYDVFGTAAQAGALATKLNSVSSTEMIILFTFDEPQGNRLTNGLPAAIYRCGGSPGVFGGSKFKYRSAYLLIGFGNCGMGNGYEAYRGDADNDYSAWCDVSFAMKSGSPIISGTSSQPTIDSTNISTYINGAAITDAQISNLDAALIRANTVQVGTVIKSSDNNFVIDFYNKTIKISV